MVGREESAYARSPSMKSIAQLAAFAAAAALTALPSSVRASRFPPLNTPSVAQHHPGKLVWADLFTTDPDAAATFYCSLLGWSATAVEHRDRDYTVFTNAGRPVAGLAPRPARGARHPSRWIGYLAVADIATTLQTAAAQGGVVRAPSRNFPDRGFQAIIADRDGIPMGLLQSSSGDAPDDEPAPGDWNWFELYVAHPNASAHFYRSVFGFAVAPDVNSDPKTHVVLSSDGVARGGIAPLPPGEDAAPSWLGVIRVADLDQTLAKVPALGGEVLVAPHSAEQGSRFAIIMDSTGGTVGLVQYVNNANPADRQ